MNCQNVITPAAASAVLDSADGHDGRFDVRLLSLDAWQEFVESHPDSTVFHHRNWIELLTSQYGGKVVIPAVFQDDQLLTAVPFLETQSLLGARKLVSLPFTDRAPLLWAESAGADLAASSGETGDIQAAAWQALQVELQSPPYRRYQAIVVRASVPLANPPRESRFYGHVIDIDRPYEAVRGAFSQGIRRNVKVAVSKGLSFEVRTDQSAMSIFYNLHVRRRRKLGVPVQPKSFFLRMHERIIAQGLGYVGLVKHGQHPAAAAVFLHYKQSVIYKYGASCPSLLELRPNELLFDRAIRWAVERDYRHFDLGVTDKDQEGLCAFKRKLAGVQSEAPHVFLAGTPRPRMQEWRARRLVSGLIRHSPAFVCRGIGKVLYRYSQ